MVSSGESALKSKQTEMYETTLTTTTLNVRGLCSRKKQFHLKRVLDTCPGIDVLAIQETKMCSDEETRGFLNQFSLPHYEVVVSHARKRSGGCMLLIRRAASCFPARYAVDNEGMVALLDVALENEPWRFLTVYAQNDMRSYCPHTATLLALIIWLFKGQMLLSGLVLYSECPPHSASGKHGLRVRFQFWYICLPEGVHSGLPSISVLHEGWTLTVHSKDAN